MSFFFSTFVQNYCIFLMSKLFTLWEFILRHKYLVVGASIVLIVGVLDENSFLNLCKRSERISQLRSEIENYKAQYEWADRQVRELETNPLAVEKMAREKYFMKRDNEDVFVVSSSHHEPAEEDEAATDSVQ